jgi:membrane-associated phospholipid phosphatase
VLRSGWTVVHSLVTSQSQKKLVQPFAPAQTSTPPRLPAALTGVRVLPPKGLNNSIYLDLNNFSRHTAWAHGFMHNYALWLGPVLLAAVFVATYAVAWWHRAPRAAALLLLGGIGTIVALGLNQLVGHAAKELRPYVAHPNALVLVAKTNDYSFPSDHSVIAGGLTLSILLVLGSGTWRRGQHALRGAPEEGATGRSMPGVVRVLAAVNLVLGLFLCFARVYVGAHYPGDVVAGYVLAAGVVFAVSLLRPFAYRLVAVADQTALGILWRRPGAVQTGGDPALEPPFGPPG